MELRRWTRRFLPAWTFFLGLLLGGLPGGLSSAGSIGAVGLYVLVTGVVWAVIVAFLRRQDVRSGAERPQA
ncbi:hypothetical protein AGMMS50218_09340 [Actinomycetota bacterium]|nr:hypothetical protein AGMMS50218_09340 [Actinomycetota bacterium]